MPNIWGTRRGQVLRWIRYLHTTKHSPVTTTDITEESGLTKTQVIEACRWLTKAGLVNRQRNGHFTAPTLHTIVQNAIKTNHWDGVHHLAPDIAQAWHKQSTAIEQMKLSLIQAMSTAKNGDQLMVRASSVVKQLEKGAA